MTPELRELVEWALKTFPDGHWLYVIASRRDQIDGKEEMMLQAAKDGWDTAMAAAHAWDGGPP